MAEPDYKKLLDEEMEWAIEQKRGLGKENPDAFTMRVKVVGPHGEVARTPLTWHSTAEKYHVMDRLSRVCRIVHARAVIVTTDTRFLDVEAFCKEFNIALPNGSPADWERFDKDRLKVMKRFDDYMGNLPAHCFKECLWAICFGPGVKRCLFTRYRVIDGNVMFDPTDSADEFEKLEIGLITPWWD